MKRIVFALAFAWLAAACGSANGPSGFGPADDGGTDGSQPLGSPEGGANDAMLGGPDGSAPHTCNPTSADLSGCSCTAVGSMHACYTGDPKTRSVGACKDGTQTCQKNGEFATWSACTGSVTPGTEVCTSTTDSNCNGKVGCADPTCAKDPTCNTGCNNGDTRPCYDGPSGTENTGACKDGTQTCVNGQWPTTCSGEVLPQPENCCGPSDLNCNGLPGCFDFSCLTAACCQPPMCTASAVDPGCVCPQGAGDTETCPDGDHVVVKNGFDECCPCAASDCANDINCCGNSVCATSPACSGLNCKPLPPSCNGQVDTDCDDFPEDCDEPCCKCTSCP